MLGIAFAGDRAGDELHARPDAAGILPASARSAEPFTENRAGGDEAALVFLQLARERARSGRWAHADGDERGEQIRRNGEPRAFGDFVDVADDFQTQPGTDDAGQQVGKTLARTFHAGRDDAGGDHRGFEQAEIILGEVEDFGQGGDVGLRVQIDADEPQHGLIDHAQIRFNRRLGRAIAAADGEIDRDIEHPRAFGEIHAEEENVAPGAVG